MYSFPAGMSVMMDALAQGLGNGLKLGTPATRLSRSGDEWAVHTERGVWRTPRVVVATPPHVAGSLLSEVAPAASERLLAVPMSAVAVVHMMGRDRTGLPEGFGVLNPRTEGVRTLGTLFLPSHIPGRQPEDRWVLTSILGGATDMKLPERSDEELTAIALADVERVTGFVPRTERVRVHRKLKGIPQLRVGHAARMREVMATLDSLGGLALAGNYTVGVSIEHAAQSGVAAARALMGEAP